MTRQRTGVAVEVDSHKRSKNVSIRIDAVEVDGARSAALAVPQQAQHAGHAHDGLQHRGSEVALCVSACGMPLARLSSEVVGKQALLHPCARVRVILFLSSARACRWAASWGAKHSTHSKRKPGKGTHLHEHKRQIAHPGRKPALLLCRLPPLGLFRIVGRVVLQPLQINGVWITGMKQSA